VLFIIFCHLSGLNRDFFIKCETKEEFLNYGANHAIEKHGMRAEDIYLNNIPEETKD
jgi:hypothetical protein